MKRFSAALFSCVLLLALSSPSFAAPAKPGAPCSKAKVVSRYKGEKVVCTQFKGKRIWVAVPGSKTATPSAQPSTQPSTQPSATPTATSSPTATPSSMYPTFTSAQVLEHNNKSSCWTIVDQKVYNVTEWINAHPGGPDRIIGMCGADASAQFRGKHRNSVDRILSAFYIGDLVR